MKDWEPKASKYPLPTPTWRYLELGAAHFWGTTPWEYDRLEPGEKAEMMAYHWVNKQIEAYHYDQIQKDTAK